VKACTDDKFREDVAHKARAYARGLQGEERLYRSVMEVLVDDYRARNRLRADHAV
jgi:hypothetical protein